MRIRAASTRGEAVRRAAATLDASGIAIARREAMWLVAHVVGKPHAALSAEADIPLSAAQRIRLDTLVRRRSRREPLQYLLGSIEFAGATLAVSPAVLIPRPETEELIGLVLDQMRGRRAALTCADLGTGSGCIAIALARAMPRSRWWAGDQSASALDVARANARANRVARRIAFRAGDWWAAFPAGLRFDLVVANPPYVAEGTALEPELAHEPDIALFGGQDGLGPYRALFAGIALRLTPGGVFMGELGLGQQTAVTHLARAHGLGTPRFARDMTGRIRFVIIEAKTSARRQSRCSSAHLTGNTCCL